MRPKATPSNPKFCRRTSGSPWDNSKVALIPQNSNLHLETKTTPNSSYYQLTTSQTIKDKLLESSLVKLSSTEKMSTIVSPQSVYHSKPANNSSRGSSQRNIRRDSDEIKMTYIPLESVNKVESISHSKKKVNESEEVGVDTKRVQEMNKLEQQVWKMRKQQKELIEDQKIKSERITQLSNEIGKSKYQNEGLKKQLTQVHQQLLTVKKELDNQKTTSNNLKCELELNNIEKLKLGQEIQLLTKNIQRSESSLKNLRQENVELIKIIEQKKRLDFGSIEKANKITKIGTENKPQQTQILQLKISSGDYQNCMNTNRQSNEAKIGEVVKQTIKKCSRFIQTENSKEVQENEGLSKSLGKEKRLRYEMGEMQRIRNNNYLIQKIQECERLIQILNGHIMAQGVTRLADKYKSLCKYF